MSIKSKLIRKALKANSPNPVLPCNKTSCLDDNFLIDELYGRLVYILWYTTNVHNLTMCEVYKT